MLKSPQASGLEIDGPAGILEALVELPTGAEPTGAAVICHPHPLHGGTMHNKVVHALSRGFLSCGTGVLRFNFRGVGASQGSFDEGHGELQDALAAIGAMRNLLPGKPLWLGGFSFGAAIAVRAAVQTDVAGLVSIAPAVSRFIGSLPEQPSCPWLIIHGENDELVAVDDTIDWVNSLAPGPELVVFPEATHFFHGRLVELREAVKAFVTDHSS